MGKYGLLIVSTKWKWGGKGMAKGSGLPNIWNSENKCVFYKSPPGKSFFTYPDFLIFAAPLQSVFNV